MENPLPCSGISENSKCMAQAAPNSCTNCWDWKNLQKMATTCMFPYNFCRKSRSTVSTSSRNSNKIMRLQFGDFVESPQKESFQKDKSSCKPKLLVVPRECPWDYPYTRKSMYCPRKTYRRTYLINTYIYNYTYISSNYIYITIVYVHVPPFS